MPCFGDVLLNGLINEGGHREWDSLACDPACVKATPDPDERKGLASGVWLLPLAILADICYIVGSFIDLMNNS